MAAVDTSVYAAQVAGTPNGIEPQALNGRVRIAYATHNTTTTAISNGDTLNLFTLPKGARILALRFDFGAMGASATATIGDSGSATRYLGSTDVSAAGTTDVLATGGFGYQLTANTTFVLTAGGANYASAKDIKVAVQYVMD